MQLKEQDLQSTTTAYIVLENATFPLGRVPIATQGEPHKQCGIARRIGYTDPSSHAQPIYRLKVQATPLTMMKTLPNFFVLAQGIFRVYQQPESPNCV